MASVKKIETTYGNVRIVTGDGECFVQRTSDDGITEGEVAVDECQLIEAVLEYAHERGLRRGRKPKAVAKAAAPKPRQPKVDPTDPFTDTPAALDA